MTNDQLDTLFKQLKSESPRVSFDETQRSVLTKIIATSGGMLGTYSLFKIVTLKKWIIMISLFSVTLTGVIIGFANTAVPEKSSLNAIKPVHPPQNELTTSNTVPQDQEKVTEFVVGKIPVITAGKNKIKRRQEFEYIISQSTKENFLIQLQKDAREVGIIVEYETVVIDSAMQSMDLRMKLMNEENEVVSNILTIMEFENHKGIYSIHWELNEDGRAVTMQSRCNSSVDLSLDNLIDQQAKFADRSAAIDALVSSRSKIDQKTERMILDLHMEMISLEAKLDYLYNQNLQNAVKKQKELSESFQKQFGSK